MLVGDIFDESTTREDMVEAASILRNMDSTYGVYYVFGNHDYNRYTSTPNYAADELREELEKNQITVLEDEVVHPDGKFYIIGRQDKSISNRKSITELSEEIDFNQLVISLDHQSVELAENNQVGIDLQFSCHTHAGQIWPSGQLETLNMS